MVILWRMFHNPKKNQSTLAQIQVTQTVMLSYASDLPAIANRRHPLIFEPQPPVALCPYLSSSS
jgi:hypothetical protein